MDLESFLKTIELDLVIFTLGTRTSDLRILYGVPYFSIKFRIDNAESDAEFIYGVWKHMWKYMEKHVELRICPLENTENRDLEILL